MTCGSWVRVSWSHDTRSRIWVPDRLDAHRRVRAGRPATDASETMTAMDASHGTSQS